MNDKIHIDKNSAVHYLICFCITVAFGWYGACIAAGAAITKEWCDYLYGKHWCWFDLGFDALGIGFGLLCNYLIRLWLC